MCIVEIEREGDPVGALGARLLRDDAVVVHSELVCFLQHLTRIPTTGAKSSIFLYLRLSIERREPVHLVGIIGKLRLMSDHHNLNIRLVYDLPDKLPSGARYSALT